MKMIQKAFLCLPVLVLFFSCVSSTYTWDETLPPEQTAVLVFGTGITRVDSYNGITPSDWQRPRAITIPSGSTALGVSASYTVEGAYVRTTYHGENMLFAYNYEPGKTYYLSFYREGGKWGIGIYSSHWARKNQRLDFVPFSNIKND
ncbi:hypothetical protein FACS1894130_02750 [Spirochaetia bacterium]|nr:hypothetical protein FACS1894130_02750 [Spirochaetia bacterium]